MNRHTDLVIEKAPGACNTEGLDTDTTNDLNYPTAARQQKVFSTLVAGFALNGYTLQRTDAGDGPVTYYATRLGVVRCLHSLDAAQCYLAQMGGAA
jgi:hypothetical protein